MLLLRLATNLTDQYSDFTDDIGLVYGTHEINNDHINELSHLSRPHLITTDDQNRIVDADEVEEPELFIFVSFPKVVITIVPVIGWLPRSNVCIFSPNQKHLSLMLMISLLDEVEPEACDYVEIYQEEKVIVEDLEQDLRALLDVALIDQLVDAEDAVDLEDADQTEENVRRERIVE